MIAMALCTVRPQLQAGDAGSLLRLYVEHVDPATGALVPLHLGAATSLVVSIARFGSSEAVERTGELPDGSDGSEGVIEYTLIQEDFASPGYYHVQALIEFGDSTYRSRIVRLRALANNPPPAVP